MSTRVLFLGASNELFVAGAPQRCQMNAAYASSGQNTAYFQQLIYKLVVVQTREKGIVVPCRLLCVFSISSILYSSLRQLQVYIFFLINGEKKDRN